MYNSVLFSFSFASALLCFRFTSFDQTEKTPTQFTSYIYLLLFFMYIYIQFFMHLELFSSFECAACSSVVELWNGLKMSLYLCLYVFSLSFVCYSLIETITLFAFVYGICRKLKSQNETEKKRGSETGNKLYIITIDFSDIHNDWLRYNATGRTV